MDIMYRQLGTLVVVQATFLFSAHSVVIAGGSGTDKSQSDIPRRIVRKMFENALTTAHEMGLSKDETVALFRQVESTAEYADPILKLSRASIDLGKISSTRLSHAMIDIENISRAAIALMAKTTCGCTQCQLETEKLLPGKATTMKVIFNPAQKDVEHEVVEQIALLCSHDGMQRKILIPVRARIKEYFRVTPGEINFGDIHRDSAYSALIRIECTDPQWARQMTVTSPAEFDASVEEPEPGQEKRVCVAIRKNTRYVSGKYGREIVLTTQLHGQSNEIRVPIYGRLWDTSIRCEPATAEIGFVGPQETRSLVCTLTSFDESPYAIEKVSSDLGEIKWRLQDDVKTSAPERSQCVQLELKAKAQKQQIIRGSVWFDIRHGGEQERVTLAVRGYCYGTLSSR